LISPRVRNRAGTAGFDELRFYSDHFNTVEVNSTFYGQPRADVTAGRVARTPARFEFSLKLYQKFTHPKMFRDAALNSAPGPEGPLLNVLAMVTRSDIDDFKAGIEPIEGEYPPELIDRYRDLATRPRPGVTISPSPA
jgi:uncharacterized protein YecE (DUF72 family)